METVNLMEIAVVATGQIFSYFVHLSTVCLEFLPAQHTASWKAV